MPPEHLQFGGGAGETSIHPLVAVYLLIVIALILVLPRRKAIAPFLFAFFTIPQGQVFVLGGFHFTALRVLILVGLARRALSPKTSSDGKDLAGFSGADWAVVFWSISAAIAFCLEFKETAAAVRAMGTLLDTLGGFLVVRFLIPDSEAIRQTLKTLAAICVVLGIGMVIEQVRHVNVFGLLGGLSTEVANRNGQVRSGATLGYLYAGAFAAALVPVFIWLRKQPKSRNIAYVGLIAATVMVWTSHSSTSYLALGGSLLGLAFWKLRKQMRLVRWALVCILVTLHIVMKAPVWALIQRIDLTGSSSGSQRYMLVDMTIRHFRDWWLFGTNQYVAWGWDSWDLCNQFAAVALTGGLLTLIFYISIFKLSFGSIGTTRKLVEGNQEQEWFLWCLGSALLGTVVAHFGINYMAQLIMSLFTLVACTSVATFEAKQAVVQGAVAPSNEQFLSPRGGTGFRVRPGKTPERARRGVSPRLKERVTS
jgi:hypothetical protein